MTLIMTNLWSFVEGSTIESTLPVDLLVLTSTEYKKTIENDRCNWSKSGLNSDQISRLQTRKYNQQGDDSRMGKFMELSMG